MDSTTEKVMDYCNNYFAVLCERVTGASVDSKAVKASFEGKYAPGMVLRIHGAFTLSYGDFGEGAMYTVEGYDARMHTLTLDKPLHTKAPNLFIAYCEPPAKFTELCAKIAEYGEKNAAREGLQSESIDGYSWSAANGGNGWKSVFAGELRQYRNPRPTRLYYARECEPWL